MSRRNNPKEEQEAVSLDPTPFQRRQELPVSPRARTLGRLQEEVTQVGGGDEERIEIVDFKGRLTKKETDTNMYLQVLVPVWLNCKCDRTHGHRKRGPTNY